MAQQSGWTINEWQAAYLTGDLSPRDALTALHAALDEKDPAFIYVLSTDELNVMPEQ